MKIRVLYEENIKNGHKFYTTIDIPDDDYSIMLDIDYEQRLAEAKPEKKAEVKRCETVQEMFDLMNSKEYNCWRRETRYIDPDPKMKKLSGKRGYIQAEQDDKSFNIMDYLCTTSDDETRSRDYEHEDVCQLVHKALGKKQDWIDMFIAVRIDGMPIRDYARSISADENNISQKLKRAEKKLKEFLENHQI